MIANPTDDTLLKQWDKLVRKRGNAPAVISSSNSEQTTFAQLDTLAQSWHAKLEAQVKRRHAVIVHLPNSAEWLAVFLALRRLGAVVVPLDASRNPADASAAAQATGATHCINTTGITPIAGVNSHHWKAGVALIKLTSGSSGTPKLFAFTEHELCADADNIMATMRFDHRDLNYALLPFAHSYALGNLVVPLLTKGVPLVLGSAAFPNVIAEELRQTRATVLPTVPTVLEALVCAQHIELSQLRLIISAAAPLSATLAQQFYDKFKLPIHNFYGASETGGIAYDRDGKAARHGHAVGEALAGVTLDVDARGRLRVTSHAVSSYRRARHAATGASITLEDKVSLRSDQQLVIHGRTDRVVKCAGVRLNLAEVERALCTHASVENAIAIFHPDKDRVTLAYTGTATKATALATLSDAMPSFVKRFRVAKLDHLPTTPRGKIDRQQVLTLLAKFPK